jgi:hypothetical protein
MTSGTTLLPFQDTIIIRQQPDTVQLSAPTAPVPVSGGDSSIQSGPSSSFGVTKPVTAIKLIAPKVETGEVELVPKPKARQEWNTQKNFLKDNGLTGIVKGIRNQPHQAAAPVITATVKPQEIEIRERNAGTNDWLLGIFLFLVILFVWIRVFYSKFFGMLASALVSFHISNKLFQERNVLLHRVSIVLDFIYLIVFSIFLFEVVHFKGLAGSAMTGMRLFLVLMNIVMLYALLRMLMLRFMDFLFISRSLFAEYLHNTFVVNKGMGILLFPVVIMAHYLPYRVAPIMLILGMIIVLAGFFWKMIRSYQIIIRRDILLFYMILYLCTLEILPLLLGFKLVTTLIKSN